MLLGRIFGTFVAVALTITIQSSDPAIELGLLIFHIAIGVITGIAASMLFGININTDRPYLQDSEDYWVEKYGERLGRDAYKLWLEELDKS